MKPESSIQKEILEYLTKLQHNKKKCYVVRVNAGFATIGYRVVKLAPAGCPDILLCYDSRFIGLEVKKKGGKQSEDQKTAQKFIEAAGGEYYIVRSLKKVKETLNI